MSREHHQELWLRYLDGHLRDQVERKELLEALRQDSAWRAELLQDRALDGVLRQSGRDAADGRAFEREVGEVLRAEKDGARFVELVRERLLREQGRAPQAAPVRGRAAIRPSRRASLRARARRASRGSPVVWVVAAAAAILLVVGVSLYWASEPVSMGRVAQVDAPLGEGVRPYVQRERGGEDLVVEGTAIRSGDTVQTLGGSLDLQLDSGRTVLKVAPSSVLWVSETAQGKRLRLQNGSLTADVCSQPANRSLVIATEDASAEVIGTRFTLVVRNGFTRLDVDEGRVLFTRRSDGASVPVAAGLFAQTRDAQLTARSQSGSPAAAVTKVDTPPTSAASARDPSEARVVSFTLINTDTDQPMPGFDPLPDGATLKLSALQSRNINLRANTEPEQLARIYFVVRGPVDYHFWNEAMPNENTESDPPYAILGDDHGNYSAWKVVPGAHTVTAIPFAGKKGSKGKAGQALTIRFTVEE